MLIQLHPHLFSWLYPHRWSCWNWRRSYLNDLKLARARIFAEGPKFSWICQLLPPICQKVFQNSKPTHRSDQRGSAENKKRSILAEERVFEAGGLQILSRIHNYLHQLTVPRLLWCKASNKARNRRFRLWNLLNLIAKTGGGVESRGLLITQNDQRREKLQDPWCWTSCYC